MNTSDFDDHLLMVDASAGDVDAFGRLYDRFCDRAYRVAYSICREEGQAQDAVQEAFLMLWRNRTMYSPARGTFAGWLITTVRYRALDLARSDANQVAHRAHDDDCLDEHPGPEDVSETVLQRETAGELRALLSDLPDEQQEVIVLAFYGQLSHTEIASQLGLPTGTVKGRMRLGLRKLRESMDRQPAPYEQISDSESHQLAIRPEPRLRRGFRRSTHEQQLFS